MQLSWKGLAIGLAAALAVGSTAPKALASTCGDLNNSGGRSVADVVLLFRAVLENPDPPNLCGGAGASQCGDVNADGNISVADVVILFSSVLGNETLFPLCTGAGNTISCPGGNATVSGSITANQIWPTGCTVFIDGQTFVQPGVVLTIQAGTTVKGKSSTANPPSFLAFLRDSKINAQGTQANPIVFTSDQPAGTRLPGDWGGLILNGRAPVNCPGGECLAEGFASSVPYGGTESNDSSGILRFVRIEFGGFILSTDNELNNLTHNGIGRGTTEDHIEAIGGTDDNFEWFGGTEIAKFMVSLASSDDNFDIQLGTTGGVQYGYAQQYAPFFQNTGQQGFEEDNNENGNDLLPRTAAKYCNMTLIGAKDQAGQAAGQESFGALERRGIAGKKAKTIIVNFKSGGVTTRDASTALVACNAGPTLTGNLNWQDSLFFHNGPTGVEQAVVGTASSLCDTLDLYRLWATEVNPIRPNTGLCTGGTRAGRACFVDGDCTGAGTCTGVPAAPDPGISFTFPNTDPRPTNAAVVASNGFNCSTLDSTFDNTSYIGAFDPAGANWLQAPWFSSAIN